MSQASLLSPLLYKHLLGLLYEPTSVEREHPENMRVESLNCTVPWGKEKAKPSHKLLGHQNPNRKCNMSLFWGELGVEPSAPTHRGPLGKTPTHNSHQLLWGSALRGQAQPGKKSIQQLMISTVLPRECSDLAEPSGYHSLASKTLRRKNQARTPASGPELKASA